MHVILSVVRFKVERYPANTRKELSVVMTEDGHRDGSFMTSTPQTNNRVALAEARVDGQKEMFLQLKVH